ncbi:hypothetical protein BP5796_11448 [Coleophoma crateriformis]|uniref:DUF1772-domain-containing protein n=1 Tax=Coleophoma crateriformis TaxID=565419 RepID=A0A3D8QI88_9HELO|nr:hypothetical protein BP5796_11448 [Coleophoma crateriformis]
MASAFAPLIYTFQAAFAGYNLYTNSAVAITNLLQYEEKAKKAAKYSNTADKQLWDTRKTQASATITVLSTLLSSAYLLLLRTTTTTKLAVAAVNVAALIAARKHVGDFWAGKAKVPVPGVGSYNEAISKTQEVRLNMLYLIGSWTLCGLLGLLT